MYVTGSQFISNRARKGGGVSLISDSPVQDMYDIILSGLVISKNNAEERGGMYMSLGTNNYRRNNHISIKHSKIMFNIAQEGGGGISILIAATYDLISESNTGIFDMEGVESDRVSIYFTDIIGNRGDIGSALKLMTAYCNSFPCGNLKYIWLKNVSISANSVNEANLEYGSAAVYVNTIHQLVLEETGFYNNTGGGIYEYNSDIVLVGTVVFENNFGHSGGAIELDIYTHYDRNCFLQLMSSSHTIIANNRALEYGGGINVIIDRHINPPFCFYQIQDNDPHGFIEMNMLK